MGKKLNEAVAILAAIGSALSGFSKVINDEFGPYYSSKDDSNTKDEKES